MTPGNWKYRKQPAFNGYYIESSTGAFIGETGGGIMHEDELLENTKLIAAAPDLLHAVKSFVAGMTGKEEFDGHNQGYLNTVCLPRAIKAIKKATK
jgi:hypothetical protein